MGFNSGFKGLKKINHVVCFKCQTASSHKEVWTVFHKVKTVWTSDWNSTVSWFPNCPVFFALALHRRHSDKVETCFAVHLGSRVIYFRVLLCGRLSYWSQTTSFWRRLGRWRLIALYNCHKDQRVASSFSCNEIRKQSTLTSSFQISKKEYMAL